MLDSLIEKITPEKNPLRLSAGIKFARQETNASRELMERAETKQRDLLAMWRLPTADPAKVHVSEAQIAAAEKDVDAARRRYRTARQSLAEARSAFEEKWLARCAAPGETLKLSLAKLADDLDEAIRPAREFESFATAHGLPLTLALARVPEAARIVTRLRELAE